MNITREVVEDWYSSHRGAPSKIPCSKPYRGAPGRRGEGGCLGTPAFELAARTQRKFEHFSARTQAISFAVRAFRECFSGLYIQNFPCGAITTPYIHCLILCWYRPSTHEGVFMSESSVRAQDVNSCKASGAIHAPTNTRSR